MPKNGRLRQNQNWHGICIIYRHQDIYEQHELKDKEKSLKRKKGKANMKKKAISLLLVGAMVAAMVAGCGNASSDNNGAAAGGDSSAKSESNSSAKSEGSSDGYTIAANIWGTGAYPLDIIVHADEKAAAVAGAKVDVADNQFTADKIVTDLQSQLASKPDAVLMFSVVDAVFGSVQELCDAQKVPYALDTNFPSDQEVWDSIKADPLFIGGIAASPYEMGKTLADQAIEAGDKTAVVLGAAIGDYSHDQRIAGFTEEFESKGGKVLQTMHCSDPSESTTKANDLVMANPDVDAVYCSGGDYLSAVAAIKAGDSSYKFDLYGTDVAPDLIDYIEQGVIQAMNGGNHVNGAISLCLLVNYLDGHQILDADGKPPVLDYLSTYLITPDNAAHFKALYADESCFISDEQFQSLLYKNNPDVTVDTYDEFLKTYADTIYNLPE